MAAQGEAIVLGNLWVHHPKPVKDWRAEHAHEIELFELSPYGPNFTSKT